MLIIPSAGKVGVGKSNAHYVFAHARPNAFTNAAVRLGDATRNAPIVWFARRKCQVVDS